MIRSLWTAATGMEAQQLNMDVIANNLANVNTTGFKKSRVDFQDLLYQTMRAAGAAETEGTMIPTGIQVGLGVRPGAVQKVHTQGDMQATGNQLDVVIEGDGFFQVVLPAGGYAYTRDGSFKTDGNGRLVTSDGYTVWPEINIPKQVKNISIGAQGAVIGKVDGETETTTLGALKIAKFQNPAGLTSIGRNLYTATEASGEATEDTPGQNGLGLLSQGFLEMSNVKVVEEMVNMIVAQRAYEVNSKSIQTADDMLSIANQLRR